MGRQKKLPDRFKIRRERSRNIHNLRAKIKQDSNNIRAIYFNGKTEDTLINFVKQKKKNRQPVAFFCHVNGLIEGT